MSLAPVPLPNLQEGRNQILERVLLNGVSNEHTRRAYRRALEKFLAWYDAQGFREISREVLGDYRTWARGRKPRAPRPPLPMLSWRRCGASSARRRRRDWSTGERRKPLSLFLLE